MFSIIKKLIFALNFNFIDNLIKFIEGIGIAVFILIFIVFLQYLYIPIFYKIETTYIIKPNIDYELLKKIEQKLSEQEKNDDKNAIIYKDPFIK
ncbi:MAG: hypothetical protein UR23_C0004G0012 [Candidatus Roizmanbacteria bacterium GW2011_GWA2_32_13]|uniref:Uncharacterized protein n=1 Tax=Candidatus Roizmanbacteria bacterium GW2011_GWA2_32_13 TaxID=1618475 RepID=A0A0G0BEX6_9BACT|nr:MAG: hypothetical protein UR23_C0004G0012 [Candidatus Roizmanbacteria bacterium GW2011_GWA2_32_13]